jgi:hypothetical protein
MKDWGEIPNLRFNALETKRRISAAWVCLAVRKQQIKKEQILIEFDTWAFERIDKSFQFQ